MKLRKKYECGVVIRGDYEGRCSECCAYCRKQTHCSHHCGLEKPCKAAKISIAAEDQSCPNY